MGHSATFVAWMVYTGVGGQMLCPGLNRLVAMAKNPRPEPEHYRARQAQTTCNSSTVVFFCRKATLGVTQQGSPLFPFD